MKTFAPLTFAASFVLLAACSESSQSPTALTQTDAEASARGVAHRIHAGGADIIAPGVDANWSLVAVQYADGSASGNWTDQFGHGNGGVNIRINCVNVVGNEAWVSGIARGGQYDGSTWVARMRDNGTSANEPEDEISYSILLPPNAQFDCRAPFPMQLMPRSGGQVRID